MHGPILQGRLKEEQLKGDFKAYTLTVEDLQDISILESRKRLSKGELSSIVFAKKIGQAFLTDDQKARKLAEGLLDKSVQTTPHLLGWLFFCGRLSDGDKKTIIDQHVGLAGELSPYFEAVYGESLRCYFFNGMWQLQTSPPSDLF